VPKAFPDLRVAIVADWLTNFGGAESVVQSFVNIFPQADIFTTVFHPAEMKTLAHTRVRTSFLQKLPKFLRRRHQLLLPFLPSAIESLNLSDYDLVLSSSSFVAKGVLTNPETLHICYCHTPTRYLWDSWQEYLREFPLPRGTNWLKHFLPSFLSRLRKWDRFAAERPDVYLANSQFIAARIKKYYDKEAQVLPPPVDFERFAAHIDTPQQKYFLAMGRMTPYKRFDLLIETFRKLPQKTLKIVGDGPDLRRLKKLAGNALNIEFLGFVPDSELPPILAAARAFLFPQIEDAGISLLEAMAAGTPAIALENGGAVDIIEEGVNGIFFPEQKVDALLEAIQHFERLEFSSEKIQDSVRAFRREKFEEGIQKFCEGEWKKFIKIKKL